MKEPCEGESVCDNLERGESGLDCHFLRDSCLFQAPEQAWVAVYHHPFHFKGCLTSVRLHMGWMIDAETHTRKHIRSHLPPFSTLPSIAIILSVTGTPVGIKTKALRGLN